MTARTRTGAAPETAEDPAQDALLDTAPALDADALLGDPDIRIIVCCGSGGVGKTTTAAALGVRAAERGRKVVVLTIDPARRLAQSMGIDSLDNIPRRVPGIDGEGAGELHAMMLDMKRTFDEIVEAHADGERARAILENPFYQSLSAGFAGTQEYMAMEKLGQLRARNEWDLIIVDTPPSRSALDFLDAPKRLGSFLDGKFIKLLMAPAKMGGRAGMKFLNVGMSMMTGTLGKLLGGQFLRDVQTFVAAMDTMFGGFRTRADATYKLLQAPVRRSSSSRHRSAMRCARPRTSWNGWPRRTCRWRVWSSTGCTAAAPPGSPPSAPWRPQKILTTSALWIRRPGRLDFVTRPALQSPLPKPPRPPSRRPLPPVPSTPKTLRPTATHTWPNARLAKPGPRLTERNQRPSESNPPPKLSP